MNLLIALFWMAALANLTAEFFHIKWLIYVSKPLIMLGLSAYFYAQTRLHFQSFHRYLLFGLLFSLLGDIFLMINEHGSGGDLFFTLGLGSFLITHLFYLTAFLSVVGFKKGYLASRKVLIFPILLFLIGNLLYLIPDVPEVLQLPVAIYCIAIVTMLAACINMLNDVPPVVYQFLLMGVLLFVLSDSIIALNKFKTTELTIPFPRLLIMIPYVVGQFLIAKGGIAK